MNATVIETGRKIRVKEKKSKSCTRERLRKAVKIIIGVVVGGVILAGLYALFMATVLPKLNTEIGNMFNYAG